jgi:phosphoribosylanthranilate isomerase
MCGMTRKEDVECAIDLGVDAIGLIFYAKSSRYVSMDKAKILLANFPSFVNAVAVLVNPEQDTVLKIINEVPINILQFHGDESPEFCLQFNKPFIKSIHPKTSKQIQQAALEFAEAQALLLDSSSHESRGGTGLTFDWNIIPSTLSKPYILAGGLNEFNLLEAIQIGKPYAVDVCSGVEVVPGIKDHKKMQQFIKVLWG